MNSRQKFVDSILANNGIACIDSFTNTEYSYIELQQKVADYSRELVDGGLYAVVTHNNFNSIAYFLSVLRNNATAVLLNPKHSKVSIEDFCQKFKVNGILDCPRDSDPRPRKLNDDELVGSEDVSLLIQTSGSLSVPKWAKITIDNVDSNTRAIISRLDLRDINRAITSLPWSYSYGLSVVLTHLLTGNTIIFANASMIQNEFYDLAVKYRVTNIGGVPQQYAQLSRHIEKIMTLRDLRRLTQAGGHLPIPERKRWFLACESSQKEFTIMYGQTEATARISILDHCDFIGREETVGTSREFGQVFSLDDGELAFKGPGVFSGYAQDVNEISSLVSHPEVLLTGDLGIIDNEGYIQILGRKKRDAKIDGLRINLDFVEKVIERMGYAVAVISHENRLYVFSASESMKIEISTILQQEFNLSNRHIRVETLHELPLNLNEKIDYIKLSEMVR